MSWPAAACTVTTPPCRFSPKGGQRRVGPGSMSATWLVAAVMAFVTFVVLLIGVYVVARQAFGPSMALVVVILIPALLTILFAVLVMMHVNSKGRSEPSRLFPKPAPIPEPSEIPRRPPESVAAGWPTQS